MNNFMSGAFSLMAQLTPVQPEAMNNFMSRPFSPDEVIGLLMMACGTAVAIIALITAHKRRAQRDDMEATLKIEMIERGMSADEVERVLAAKMAPPVKTSSCNRQSSGNRVSPVS
jgi:hypothetical protein